MNIYNSFLFFIVLMLKSPRLQPAGAPSTGSGAAVTCHLFIYLLLASWHSEMFQAHCCRSGPKSGPFSQEPWLLSVGEMLGTKVGCWGGCPPCPPRTPTHVCAPPTRRQTHIQADARRCTLEKSHIHTCPTDRSLPDPCGCSPTPRGRTPPPWDTPRCLERCCVHVTAEEKAATEDVLVCSRRVCSRCPPPAPQTSPGTRHWGPRSEVPWLHLSRPLSSWAMFLL